MRRGFALIGSLVLLGASGCGGEDEGRPGATEGGGLTPPPADPCEATEGYVFASVSDFEVGPATGFWVSSDKTESFMEPADGTNSPRTAAIEAARCGVSTRALRIQARDLVKYGGAFGVTFAYRAAGGAVEAGEGVQINGAPVDASQWEGLSLWVRRGPESGSSLFVGLNERHTDEQGSLALSDEPYCLNDTPNEADKCDRFGAGVPLTEAWQFVAIPFSQMKQRGFGVVAPYLDVAHIQGLNMGFEIGDWDIWIDDLSFYRTASAP